MNRALRVLVCVLLFAPGCTTTDSKNASASDERSRVSAEAHALLDDYVGNARQLARASSTEVFLEVLAEQEVRARELDPQGKLDAAFRDRHRRLLEVTRAIVQPGTDTTKVAAFAREVAGPDGAPVDPDGGLAALAPLLLEEVLSLHMLLDGATDREAARAKYLGSDR